MPTYPTGVNPNPYAHRLLALLQEFGCACAPLASACLMRLLPANDAADTRRAAATTSALGPQVS